MSGTAEKKREKLRQKNVAFLKRKFPDVYKLLTTHDIENKKPLSNENGEWVDLLERGSRVYNFDCIEYSKKECSKFLDNFKPGNEIKTVVQASTASFTYDRLASNKLRVMHEELEKLIDISSKFEATEFIPMILVFGIGMGYHITELVKSRPIGSLIIFDNDIENLIISLSTTDWEWVDSHFKPNEGTSLQFVFSHSNIAINDKSIVWNTLIKYCPQFPFTTYLYNHHKKPKFNEIIEKIQGDLITFMGVWGHYDDEVNQYNNCRHNLKEGIKVLNPQELNLDLDKPVAIIGGGPSIDNRISTLKKYKDDLLIVSCGSALGTLYHYDLTPDIHIELESDYLVYDVIKNTTSEEYRENILFIGSAQMNPWVFRLFKNKLLFFKDSASIAEEFSGNLSQIIRNVTPTCSNAGFAIIDHLKFKNIYLFGMDFGFEDESSHHAKGSVHYKEGISEQLKNDNDFEKNELIKVKGVNNKNILTKTTYEIAKKRVEEGLKSFKNKNKSARNCSDGSIIRGASWTDNNAFELSVKKILSHTNTNKLDLIEDIKSNSEYINSEDISKKCNHLILKVESIFRTLEKRMLITGENKEIFLSSFIINNILEQHVTKKMGYTYFFIRGYIWIVLSTYYNVGLKSKSKETTKKCTKLIKGSFINLNNEIINEMKEKLISNNSIETDPWINEEVPIHYAYK